MRLLPSTLILLFAMLVTSLLGEEILDPHLDIPTRPADFTPWSERLHQYYRHIIGDQFSKSFNHGQPWAAGAMHLFEGFARSLSHSPGAMSNPALLKEAQDVIDQGSDDPVVSYACGLCYEETGKRDKAEGCYGKARSQFKVSAYAPELLQRCIGRHMAIRMHNEQRSYSPETLELRKEWIAISLVMLRDERVAEPMVRSVFAEILGHGFDGGRNTKSRLHTALLEDIALGGVNPWLGEMIKGAAAIDLAWTARGNSYADKVTDAGWKGFAENLDVAKKSFTAAWALDPTLALSAAEMLTVVTGNGEGVDEQKKWMNRAISAQLDFPEAYSRLFWAWEPRWGGSYDAMLSVGQQVLATKAFDTGLPEFLLVAIAAVEKDLASLKQNQLDIWSDPKIWPAIRALFGGYLAEPSRASIRDWDLTRYAAYAWRCGAHDQVGGILARITSPIDAELFQSIAHESLDMAQKTVAGAGDF